MSISYETLMSLKNVIIFVTGLLVGITITGIIASKIGVLIRINKELKDVTVVKFMHKGEPRFYVNTESWSDLFFAGGVILYWSFFKKNSVLKLRNTRIVRYIYYSVLVITVILLIIAGYLSLKITDHT